MNSDRKTPIGKAVDSSFTDDDRPEVEGHRGARMNTPGLQDRVFFKHEDVESSAGAEVEGHRGARMNTPEPQDRVFFVDDEAGSTADAEVEGHRGVRMNTPEPQDRMFFAHDEAAVNSPEDDEPEVQGHRRPMLM